MEETFDEIESGRYSVEERSVLQLICDDKHLQDAPYALNEIAVLKRDSSSMISIRTAINSAYLNVKCRRSYHGAPFQHRCYYSRSSA